MANHDLEIYKLEYELKKMRRESEEAAERAKQNSEAAHRKWLTGSSEVAKDSTIESDGVDVLAEIRPGMSEDAKARVHKELTRALRELGHEPNGWIPS